MFRKGLDRILGRTGKDAAWKIYHKIVTRARTPEFYRTAMVPDSVDGRFEMIVVHLFLVLHALKGRGKETDRLEQDVMRAMFDDMDRNLREMGVGDLAVGKKVKFMAKSLNGRVSAYDNGLEAGTDSLVQALSRNVYGTVVATEAICEGCRQLASDVSMVAAYLGGLDSIDLLNADFEFPPVSLTDEPVNA